MVYDNWLPHYLTIGIDHKSFFHSTPRILSAYDEAHKEKLKEKDMFNWYLGQYFADALLSTIGNSGLFHKQGAKPNEYPQQPYLDTIKKMREENERELTEEEKIEQTKALFARLEVMAANSRLEKDGK